MALRRSFGLFSKKSNTRFLYSCSDHAHLEQYAKDHGHHDSLFGSHHPHHSDRFFHTEARELTKTLLDPRQPLDTDHGFETIPVKSAKLIK